MGQARNIPSQARDQDKIDEKFRGASAGIVSQGMGKSWYHTESLAEIFFDIG